MAIRHYHILFDLYFFVLLGAVTPHSYISNDAIKRSVEGGSSLFEDKCSIKFWDLNLTGIATYCEGPGHPAKNCCDSVKQFACPYIEAINDWGNNCAKTIFGYMNLYARYPPGVLLTACKDPEGLYCVNADRASVEDMEGNPVLGIVIFLAMVGFMILVRAFCKV